MEKEKRAKKLEMENRHSFSNVIMQSNYSNKSRIAKM